MTDSVRLDPSITNPIEVKDMPQEYEKSYRVKVPPRCIMNLVYYVV